VGLHLIAAFDLELLGSRLWAIGSVAVGLGFVIFVHELGHFLVAKWCGVKCEKFYVGFDVPIKIFGFELPSKLFHYQWGVRMMTHASRNKKRNWRGYACRSATKRQPVNRAKTLRRKRAPRGTKR
jgi:hypothetical protein